MSAAASLKTALAYNGLTVEQLVAMREQDAMRLPYVGPKVLAEARRQASKRGGARPGAGRKATDGAAGLIQVAVRITPAQREKLSALGGSVWVRRAISEAGRYDVDDMADIPPMPDQKEIGEAIDWACEQIERMQWRPIETAPEDGTHFLAYFPLRQPARGHHATSYALKRIPAEMAEPQPAVGNTGSDGLDSSSEAIAVAIENPELDAASPSPADGSGRNVEKLAPFFIVIAAKRRPVRFKTIANACEAAKSAIRSGAQRAEVFALVPLGTARRGAEWKEAN